MESPTTTTTNDEGYAHWNTGVLRLRQGSRDNLEQGYTHIIEALKTFTFDAFPEQHDELHGILKTMKPKLQMVGLWDCARAIIDDTDKPINEGDVECADWHRRKGTTSFRNRNWIEAEQSFANALRNTQDTAQIQLSTTMYLSLSLAHLGRVDDAIEYMEKCLCIVKGDEYGEPYGSVRHNYGVLHSICADAVRQPNAHHIAAKHWKNAYQQFEKALEKSRTKKTNKVKWAVSMTELARCKWYLYKINRISYLLDEAAGAAFTIARRQPEFFSANLTDPGARRFMRVKLTVPAADLLVSIRCAQKKTAFGALFAMERGRALCVSDLRMHSELSSANGKVYDEWRTGQAELRKLEAARVSTPGSDAISNTRQRKIARYKCAAAADKANLAALDTPEITKSYLEEILGPNVIMLSFYLSPDWTGFVMVCTDENGHVVEDKTEIQRIPYLFEQFKEKLDGFINARESFLEGKGTLPENVYVVGAENLPLEAAQKDVSEHLHEISRYLPLEAALKTISDLSKYQLILMPHGLLHEVPLAALPMPDFGDGYRLGDCFPRGVVVAPSLQLLRHVQRRHTLGGDSSNRKRTLVCAEHPDFNEASHVLKAAEASGRCAASIAPTHDAADVLELLRNADVWHLSCHGNFSIRNYADITLDFGNCQLSALDFLDKVADIACELVVCSGCVTASMHDEWKEDECFGVGTILLVAGAKWVVGSLWNVHVTATELLMKLFYEELLREEGCHPAKALLVAQHRMQKETLYTSPYYWAAFVVMGVTE